MDEADMIKLNQQRLGGENESKAESEPNMLQPGAPPSPHRDRRFPGNFRSRFTLLALLLVVLTVGVILSVASNAARYRDAELRQNLLVQVNAIAKNIDHEFIKKLSFTAADRELPEFQRLHQQMMAFKASTEWRGVWSVVRRNGQFVFGPESYAGDDPMASPPGTVYQQPPSALSDIFQTRNVLVQGPYQDEYGSFISAFAPIIDPCTGEVLMVVGLDLESTKWQASLARARWISLAPALPVVLIILGGAFIFWRRRRLSVQKRPCWQCAEVGIIVAVGLALTMALALDSVSSRAHSRHQAFHRQAELQANQIITAFTELQDYGLDTLGRIFEAVPIVDRDGFRFYTKPLMRKSNLMALEWIQPVPVAQQDEVEALARAEGLPDFAIWQHGPEGKKEPASRLAVSYPVRQVEQIDINKDRERLGYDVGSEPAGRAALENAIKTGLPSATEPIPLGTGTGEGLGFMAFQPVFSGQPPMRTLRGLVAMTVIAEPFLRANISLQAAKDVPLGIELYQLKAGQPPRFLASCYSSSCRDLPGATSSGRVAGDAGRDNLTAVFPIFVFGQSYALTIQTPPGSLQALSLQEPLWIIVSAGILITTLMAMIFIFLLQRRDILETLVQTRTAELRQREAYFGNLMDILGEGVFTLELSDRNIASADRCITYINQAVSEILGYLPDEVIGQLSWMLYPTATGYLDLGRRLAEGIERGQRGVRTEHIMRHKDGHPVLVELHSTFLEGAAPSLTVIAVMRDVTARKRSEERLRRINECLLDQGSGFQANVNRLTALAGELLEGDCALYLRFFEGTLHSEGQWQIPADFQYRVDLEGSVCEDLIRSPGSTARFIPDLQESEFARTNPNVLAYNLRSFFGHNVRCGEVMAGCLCVLFKRVVIWSEDDQHLLGLFAAALAVEEARHDAKQQLRMSEARYRLLVENTSDITYAVDMRGRLTYVGVQAAQYGLQPELMIGEDFLAFILPEDYDYVKAGFVRSLETGEEFMTIFRPRLPSGAIPWFEARSKIISNELGEAREVLGVLRDVTDREAAKQALERANVQLEQRVVERTEQLEKFFSVGLDLFCIADTDGHFRELNQAWENTLGYTRAELMAESFLSFVHPDDLKSTFAALAELADQKVVTCFTNRYRCKDGAYRWLEWHSIPVNKMIYAAAHDVTERLELEKRLLIAKNAADKANLAKSVFVGNMSHEIRTPLNAIIGFAQILERDASLPVKHAEHVHTILRSGQHLQELINDILNMAKIEGGTLTLEPTVFCIDDLLNDLELMFNSLAEAKGLRLLVARQEGTPPYIIADQAKLRQILINLMGNAVKMTSTGWVAVRIRADAAPDDTSGDNREPLHLLGEVEDTGPGIPAEDWPRVFQAFQQSANGREAGGSGLGLAITERLVELMGGRITIENRPGKGCCFRFSVPVKPVADVAEGAVTESSRVIGLEPGAGPVRILVVDDKQDNRTLLRAFLEPVGFEIKEAVNGQEALEVFKKWSPHAVLMDIRMPVMDGYEATRRIKATAKTGEAIPVIAVTANAFENEEKEALAAGIDSYIRKPLRAQELFKTIGEFLGLRYVYAENDGMARDKPPARSSITREDLASLPEELIAAMRQAVEDGNMIELKELITQVEKLNLDAARELQRLARNYNYKKLNLILEP